MKNLGSINGKVEILVDATGPDVLEVRTIALISSSNYIELSPLEAIELSEVIAYAATNQLHLLKPSSVTTFIPSKDVKLCE